MDGGLRLTVGTSVRRAPVRDALVDATELLLDTCASLDPEDWDRPATDAWTVRQLVAHVVRSLAVTDELLDDPGDRRGPDLPDGAAYYRSALAVPGVHDGVATRAVEAADAVGPDPVPWARAVVGTVLDRVAATPGDRPVPHRAGTLPLDDYLVTRVVEVVLHTVDVQRACGRAPSAPDTALAVVVPFLLSLADRADPLALALALSGRPGQPVCDVLG